MASPSCRRRWAAPLTSDCPDDPDNVATPSQDPVHDSMNDFGKDVAGIAAVERGPNGDEMNPAPALEHFDAPDQLAVVHGESLVQGIEDRARQVGEHYEAKMADAGR